MEERGHELSSFDKYKREVLSGSLAWTPIHTEPQFWLQNVNHFDDKARMGWGSGVGVVIVA